MTAPQRHQSPEHADELGRVLTQVGQVVIGKNRPIQLALACLLARGHLLIEDLPGVGKTTLAHALAKSLGLQFQRIQFTSDLLPSDIIGVSIYDREAGRFSFHPGPVFSQLVVADEINRATPKTQSALLEAMEEHQVTVEGETRRLPSPFFVIATQNPTEQVGTFPLPESQLDRFMMRISVGYPDAQAERALLAGEDRRLMIERLPAALGEDTLTQLQMAAAGIHVSAKLLDYVQRLLQWSRLNPQVAIGLSPRAGLSLVACARAWALIEGRDYALPEDVQTVLGPVAAHRLQSNALSTSTANGDLIEAMLEQTPVD
jgi:MoxR-like ATPase